MQDTVLHDLRKLNKELLARNGELVKKLHRVKTERDNFERLFLDWKKINRDASEALTLLQNEKTKLEQSNARLQSDIDVLLQQNNERSEQCNHLLLRCNELQQIRQSSEEGSQSADPGTDVNQPQTLRFNYQQKKNEIEQILYETRKFFQFFQANYPEMIGAADRSLQFMSPLNGVREHECEPRDRSPHSLSDFDKNVFRTRKSLGHVSKAHSNTSSKKKGALRKRQSQPQTLSSSHAARSNVNIVISDDKAAVGRADHRNNNLDSKITPEQLLGPKTSYRQYDADRPDPFGRTLSSHSYFTDSKEQVQLHMAGNGLWQRRDSLTKKRKHLRINAIPSSAGSTPLATPQHSLRGRLSDEEEEHDVDIVDDHELYNDAHCKYLEMMGSGSGNTAVEPPPAHKHPADKEAIHDLFDMLQQNNSARDDAVLHGTADVNQDIVHDHSQIGAVNDAQLVPLPEPVEYSPQSNVEYESDSSSD